MARYYTNEYYREGTDGVLNRATITIGDHYVEGGGLVWVAAHNIAGFVESITLLNYDSTRAAQYRFGTHPHIIIKNTQDSSGTNLVIKNMAGNTLYTFAANNSVTPAYVVFRIDGTTKNWELA